MTASEYSYIGLAKQVAEGTANTTVADYKYLLTRQGTMGPQNIAIPLDPEIGGGALLRSMVKVGVSGMGALDIIPRPETLGLFLHGVTGFCSSYKNLISGLAWHAADGSTHTTPWANQPTSSTKMWVAGALGAAGLVSINDGAATATLTGNNHTATTKTFQTITRVEFPPTPATSTTTTVAIYKSDGVSLVNAAVTLTAAYQVDTAFDNATPADSLKLRVVSDQYANGLSVKIIGTNAGGAVISEVVFCFPYELVETNNAVASFTNVILPISADDFIAVLWHDSSYTHIFKLDPYDHFAAPWYTAHFAPGNLWGEQIADCRVNALSLDFRGANFVSGAVGLIGKTPSIVDTLSTWEAATYVDGGPQLLSPLGDIELPSGTDLTVLRGTFGAVSAIPMDEQYVIGSYYPNGLDVVSRAFQLSFDVKIATTSVLYQQMMYKPSYASGAQAWTAEIFRNGDMKMEFLSDQDACANPPSGSTSDYRPYKLSVSPNAQSGDNANVIFAATPLALRAQRQVVMTVSGTFMASPNSLYDPISFTLINRRASYA